MEHRHDPDNALEAAGTLTEELDVTAAPADPIESSPPQSPPQSFLSSSATAVASTESLGVLPDQSRVQSRHAGGANRTRRASPLSYISRFSTLAKAATGDGSSSTGWLGVSARREDIGGSNAWVITISKVGRWFVYFHLAITAVNLFSLATTIYSWKSNADNDVMMQKVLTAVSSSGSALKGIDNEIMKWMNTTKLRNAEEDSRLAEEQNRWNALLNVFEDCGVSQSRPNGTDTCDNLRQFFESNPLPHPDKSPIAKRNIAELDRIIQRVHLGRNPQLDSSSGFGYGPHSADATSILVIALVTTIPFCLLAYWISRRLGSWNLPILTRHRKKAKDDARSFDEKQVEDAVEDDSVPIIATGGDYFAEQNNLHRRNLRKFDPHAAAARGSLGELIDNQSTLNFNQVDEENEHGSLLSAAAKSGSLETVQYILSRKPNVNVQGGRYHNALQAGAHSGNDSIVDLLLEAGARDTSTGGFYGTAANAAAERGSGHMLRSLLNHYPDKQTVINETGGSHGHAIVAAAFRGDEKAVQTLLDEGALVDQCHTGGTTALHQAVAYGHFETMVTLIFHGAKVDTLSNLHGTPLHAACRSLQVEAAQHLLTNNADVSIRDQRQRLPLHEAAQAKEGLHDLVESLSSRRPDLVDAVDADGVTALHLASIAGNVKTVDALLDANASCSIGDKFQAQPLFRAAGCGHTAVVELLLRKGQADPNATDIFGRAALHGPSETADVSIQAHLIHHNANVNITGSDGKTPLHESCNMGHLPNTLLLLSHPAIAVNTLDNDQSPPLYKALCSSDSRGANLNSCLNRDIVTALLARPDIDPDTSTALAVQEAARKGYLPEVRSMLARSTASLHMRGGKYGGVLQAAAISGDLPLINTLLNPAYHADVNLPGGEFGGPLAAAAAFGHVAVVRRLLEAGADPAMGGGGRFESPYQAVGRAVERGRLGKGGWARREDEIRGLLREYGAGATGGGEGGEERYKGWRWALTTTGWRWVGPGEP